jgi:transcription elongation factor Elf1
MEALLERLFFLCPTTRRAVDVGVETEIGTLLRIKSETLSARCPACGQTHEWKVREAALPKAA